MSLNNKIINDESYIIWDKPDKLTTDDILMVFEAYLASPEYQRLRVYKDYFQNINPDILYRWQDRKDRGKTPNHLVPTSYYTTLVETISGYMFQNVQYSPEDEEDKSYSDTLNQILDDNYADVKDMITGINAVAYNKGIELVYTIGDGMSPAQVRFANLNPYEVICIYDNKIEPDLFCAIRYSRSTNKSYDYNLDVIYADEWQSYYMKNKDISEREPSRPLYFSECPVIVYKSNISSQKSVFHQVLPYIAALDFIITGNSNEIERIVDALLVLGKQLKDDDLEHMDEWKALEGFKTEDRAEYITKDMSPQFREYVSKLLIQEIHKHSHVVDWYSPDQGISGTASAKALKTRLFDMDMFSNKIEKIYRRGIYKRIKLISEIIGLYGNDSGKIKVIFNRTTPNDMEEKATALNPITFISDQTKIELCGLDYQTEKDRLEEQKQANIETMELMTRTGDESNGMRDEEETEETEEASV